MRHITAAAGPMTVPLLVRRFLADYARNPAGTRTRMSRLTGLRA